LTLKTVLREVAACEQKYCDDVVMRRVGKEGIAEKEGVDLQIKTSAEVVTRVSQGVIAKKRKEVEDISQRCRYSLCLFVWMVIERR